ncbi:MAG: hypothetical protein ACK47D_05420 [Pseudanabaena sp.]
MIFVKWRSLVVGMDRRSQVGYFFEGRSLFMGWIGDRCLADFLEGRSLFVGMDRRSLVMSLRLGLSPCRLKY